MGIWWLSTTQPSSFRGSILYLNGLKCKPEPQDSWKLCKLFNHRWHIWHHLNLASCCQLATICLILLAQTNWKLPNEWLWSWSPQKWLKEDSAQVSVANSKQRWKYRRKKNTIAYKRRFHKDCLQCTLVQNRCELQHSVLWLWQALHFLAMWCSEHRYLMNMKIDDSEVVA